MQSIYVVILMLIIYVIMKIVIRYISMIGYASLQRDKCDLIKILLGIRVNFNRELLIL